MKRPAWGKEKLVPRISEVTEKPVATGLHDPGAQGGGTVCFLTFVWPSFLPGVYPGVFMNLLL